MRDRFSDSLYNDTDINEQYFLYLCRLIGINNFEKTPFKGMLKILYNYEFYWVVEMDANRIEDTISLKDDFKYNTNYINYDQIYDFCSVLEILVVLAISMNDNLESLGVPYWFWHMISNLNINYEDDLTNKEAMEIMDILKRFVNRDYSEYGLLFPIKNPKKDQRKVELWYQMNEYYNENF